MKPPAEPIFNVPAVLVALLAVLVLVQAARAFLLTPEDDINFLLEFAFIPARYESSIVPGGTFPGGFAADIWTFVTYALIHGDIVHLGVNSIWLLPFGTAVARRLGAVRFLIFFAVTAAAGALAHLVTHSGALLPMVGASASISGFMAAAIRFAFQSGGPIETWRRADLSAYYVPAAPLSVALRDSRILIFLALWFALNLLFGVGTGIIPGAEQAVAWQAHVGGFIAGLVLFPLFDPVPAAPQSGNGGDAPPTLH